MRAYKKRAKLRKNEQRNTLREGKKYEIRKTFGDCE
jgi:hypothetical protein